MLFGATHACPGCLLRFAASKVCPACGGRTTFDLSEYRGRVGFRESVQARGAGARRSPGLVLALGYVAGWMPERPWLVRVLGLLLVAPSIGMIFNPDFGRHLWIGLDANGHMISYRKGLTEGGLTMILFGLAGVVVLATSIVPLLAARAAKKVARAQGTSLGIHTAGAAAGGDVIEGIVRGEARRTAPISREACIAFGLRGDADGAIIDDAEGDDFEVETPAGARFVVRVRHAVLEMESAPGPVPAEIDGVLAGMLDARGVRGASACTLAEVTLRDGDVVAVSGRLGKGKRQIEGYRDVPVSTLEGTVEAPVRIRKRAA